MLASGLIWSRSALLVHCKQCKSYFLARISFFLWLRTTGHSIPNCSTPKSALHCRGFCSYGATRSNYAKRCMCCRNVECLSIRKTIPTFYGSGDCTKSSSSLHLLQDTSFMRNGSLVKSNSGTTARRNKQKPSWKHICSKPNRATAPQQIRLWRQ